MSANKERRRVGIHDVAREVGVSATTVSHALNGKGRVGAETRRRVFETAKRLGYRANQNAVNLKNDRLGLLAVTIGAPADNPIGVGDLEYFIDYVSAATTTALERSFTLLLIPSTKAEALSGIEIDGALVIDPVADDPLIDALRDRRIPVVTGGRDPEHESDLWVDNDLRSHSRRMLEHMQAQGAERIGLIIPPPIYSYAIDLRDGYRDWCADRGQEPLLVEAASNMTEKAGHAAALELLSGKDRPDAIVAGLDRHALGALLAAESLGIRVPEEMMLASATDSRQMAAAVPSITSLDLNPEIAGSRAVEMLIGIIENPEARLGPVEIPVSLVARESTLRRKQDLEDAGAVDALDAVELDVGGGRRTRGEGDRAALG